jgi:uncharacterized protein YcnI
VTAVVVVSTHVLSYALAPRPSLIGARLEYAAGGPRPVLLALCAIGLAAAVSSAALWIVAVGVAERSRLESLAVALPQISVRRMLGHGLALFCATAIAFALLESYLHWRAGLGWHGLRCLVGPVHRNALPILAVLSLLASALAAAVTHLVAWMRRVVAALRTPCVRVRRRSASSPCSTASPPLRSVVREAGLGPRAPPSPISSSERRPLGPSGQSTRRRSDGMNARRKRGALALPGATIAVLVFATGAWAHAEISPVVTKAKAGQVFTLAVPTEEEGATTTKIELTPPAGFAIDSFAPSPGWKRELQQTGSGEAAVIQKVTWSGGSVPTGEDAIFQFIASPNSSKTYRFAVRQTYSNGKVVDWAGPESSDTPAPTVEAKSSLGGGGNQILAIVALVVGALGLLVGLVSLVGGRRQLT